MKRTKSFIKKYYLEIAVFLFALTFSFWLMFSTFSYNDGSILIASKAWSDFASHVPLIRSFSFGDNFPPQYPIFPGEPIRYHYLFYLLVGLLEKSGLRIDYALNIPSALSFALLIFAIFYLGKVIFKSRTVGLLSVLFFLFNGSFSFIEFFKNHPLSLSTINDIATNTTFPSFGPYDDKIVSAFWNLNIYTNQRHLAFSFAFLLFLVAIFAKLENNKKPMSIFFLLIIGIFIGILPLLHSSIFIMTVIVLISFFLLIPKQRKKIALILLIAFVVSFPRLMFLKQMASFTPQLKIGYLASENLTVFKFMTYWLMNLGLYFILIPISLIKSPKSSRKFFFPFLILFLLGNLIQISPEPAGNHKFFNAFIIVSAIYVSYFIVSIWKKNILGKIISLITIFFLILSGIIDFFPIKNDKFIPINDVQKNESSAWVKTHTLPSSTFLNSSYLYHPASIAGRKIFLGWPYFSWSLGYDTLTRDKERTALLATNSLQYFCIISSNNKLDYVFLDNKESSSYVNQDFFKKNFIKVYENQPQGVIIYSIKSGCQ